MRPNSRHVDPGGVMRKKDRILLVRWAHQIQVFDTMRGPYPGSRHTHRHPYSEIDLQI